MFYIIFSSNNSEGSHRMPSPHIRILKLAYLMRDVDEDGLNDTKFILPP
jgi:hypothetical protein